MIVKNIAKRNYYYDSVTLMMISSKLTHLEGIKNAAVMMGTDYNKSLMINSDLLLPEYKDVSPNDMIIGIMAEDEASAETALKAAEEYLINKKVKEGSDDFMVKTTDAAIKRLGNANFAIISVPGKYAKNEAMRALDNNLHVLLFSDNVSIEEELELKEKAVRKGLLMMGPDCGTAIINGVGLGFANVVNRGNIGIVAAAGTGLQEVSTIISRLGGGISQALGTGGRDLKEQIGGKMMLMGLEALSEDDNTKVIVLISKSPSAMVMKEILEKVKSIIDKHVVTCFLGGDPFFMKDSGAIPAQTLEDAAIIAVRLNHNLQAENLFFTTPKEEIRAIARNEIVKLKPGQKYVRGLYSGGTLCYEGMLILRDVIGDIYSNVPLKSKLRLESIQASKEHTFIDMGDDFFTNGRPHPMIDPRLRVERIKQECSDPETAVILLDVVLGYGSNEDPAGALVPAVLEAKQKAVSENRYVSVVASVCGMEHDPQIRGHQEEKLREAGIIAMPSNAQASKMAALIVTRGKYIDEMFGGE